MMPGSIVKQEMHVDRRRAIDPGALQKFMHMARYLQNTCGEHHRVNLFCPGSLFRDGNTEISQKQPVDMCVEYIAG
jgi:hypothetical protein